MMFRSTSDVGFLFESLVTYTKKSTKIDDTNQ